jgi:hypothetical protein
VLAPSSSAYRGGLIPLALVLLAVTWIVGAPPPAAAEPYLAARFGAKCNDCHTNLTGGGKRTPLVAMHAHEILKDLEILPLPDRVQPFTGELTDFFSIGADVRFRNTYVFNDNPNARGRVSNDRFFRDRLDSIDFDVNEANVYFEADLWPDLLTLYADEQFAPGGVSNREVFGLLQNVLPWTVYAKGGKFFLPYGLSIQDDTAFVRSLPGITFDTPDTGVELGAAPGPTFFAASVTDGTEGNREVVVTLNGYALFNDVPYVRTVLAGASWSRQSPKRNVAAFYAGSNLWTLTYLAEIDVITDNRPGSNPRDQLAAYAEVNWLLFDWLNVRGTFDFAQIGNDNNQNRFGIGLEAFVNRFLQPRIFYRAANAPPTDLDGNRADLIAELHIFF